MKINSNIKVISLSCLVVATIIAGFILYSSTIKERNAWVNLNKVYGEFGLKKDLENKLKVVETARKKILDSLELNLKILATQLQAIKDKREEHVYEFQLKKQEYLLKKQQLEEDNTQLQSEFNEQILTQMNQYVKDFGISKNYSIILGANGSGAVMYAKDNIEITEEVLAFINKKYKGEN
jgi:outer membrane protein